MAHASRTRHLRVPILILAAWGLLPGAAVAQPAALPDQTPPLLQADDRDATSTDESVSFGALVKALGGDFKRLPSWTNLATLAIGGAGALAAAPGDETATRRATASPALDRVFEAGDLAGSGWIQVGGAFGVYITGRAGNRPRLQRIGADLVRAQAVNAVLTHGLKHAVRRTRPDGTRHSFPSGHTSGTFATAVVLHRHFGAKVGVPAMAAAAYVAASRVQENRHFPSDVIFGAAVGIVSGRAVTVGSGTNRYAVAPGLVPGGFVVSLVRVGRAEGAPE